VLLILFMVIIEKLSISSKTLVQSTLSSQMLVT
jgi:hypothetical protein